MASLSKDQQTFIVRELARWRTPAQVAASVKERFDVAITRQAVEYYDPDKCASRGKLAQEWVDLFRAERARFTKDLDRIPIYHTAWRLEEILQMYRDVLAGKPPNRKFALELLDQAQGEVDALKKASGGAAGAGSLTPDERRERFAALLRLATTRGATN